MHASPGSRKPSQPALHSGPGPSTIVGMNDRVSLHFLGSRAFYLHQWYANGFLTPLEPLSRFGDKLLEI